MTTVLDIQALQAAAGIRISLAENVRVRSGSVTSEAVQGFSDVRAVELVVRVPVLRGHPAPSVSVTVESSVNGSDWTTGHAFAFTATGDDSFTLDAPDDYLRVVCAPAGGLREAVVSVVASIVTVDAPAGESEGGGSQAVLMHSTSISSAQLLALDSTPIELLPAPGGRFYYFVSAFLLHYRFVTTPYTGSNNDGPGFAVGDLDFGFGAAPLSNATIIHQVFGTSTAAFLPVDLFAQTADAYIAAPIQPGYGDWLASSIENAAVTLQFLNGAALADGDGTLTVRLWYSLIDGAP